MTDPLIAKLTELAEEATHAFDARDEDPVVFLAASGALHDALVTAWPAIKARLEAADRLRSILPDLYEHLPAQRYDTVVKAVRLCNEYDLTKTERTETA